jgi:hypothetical protein
MADGGASMTNDEISMLEHQLEAIDEMLNNMETGRACNPEPLLKSLFAELSELYANYEMSWDVEEDAV